MKLMRAVFKRSDNKYEISSAYPGNEIEKVIQNILSEREDLRYLETILSEEFHRMVAKVEREKE